MSYGFYRLGSNVVGKVLPHLGPAPEGSAIILDASPLPLLAPIIEPAPTELPTPQQMGFTGNTCSHCGSSRMMVAGHCEVCSDCGTTTGCS